MNSDEIELCLELGRQKAYSEMVEVIKTEKLWKTQDEGFVGALDWMLLEIETLRERRERK